MPLSYEAAQQLKLEVFKKNLRNEFAGQLAPDEIDMLMEDSIRRLRTGAKVEEFVPLMAYSFTSERLRSLGRPTHRDGEPWDVVFVSHGGGGPVRSRRR